MSSRPEVPLFEDPAFDPARDLAGVAPDLRGFVRDMQETGGAVLDLGAEAGALCDRAAADAERLMRGASRVQDAWRRSRAIRRLALDPTIRRALAAAYGRRPFAFQTLNFQQGSEQPLHSDVIHFSSLPARFMCGVWIALEDVQPGAGPLVYYPGSHRLPLLTMREVGVNSDAPGPEDYERVFVPRFATVIAGSGLKPSELFIRKGQAFVWAANLAHGGTPITTPGSTRKSLVAHYYFEDCLYFTPMTSDVEAGRLSVRLPPDVRTRGWRWPRIAGRRAPVRPRAVLTALREMTREPFVS
ncbi:MAG: phytanoyl-CoA dioxygenase [Phenylobacterium sp.]|nr:MAG: phytanoyl-CoA dioxygenase [Phenylobacterium sp.]